MVRLMIRLNYKDTKSILSCISEAYRIDCGLAIQTLEEITLSECGVVSGKILDRFDFIIGRKPEITDAVWFHGTRVRYPYLKERGLLPRNEVEPELRSFLNELAKSEEIESYGANPFSQSINAKLNVDRDYWPNASSFYIVATSTNDRHNYCRCPELILDIAGELVGSDWARLVNCYMKLSMPCVVSFVAPPSEHHLEIGLLYLYRLVKEGLTELNAAEGVVKYLSPCHEIVSPRDILSVDVLDLYYPMFNEMNSDSSSSLFELTPYGGD